MKENNEFKCFNLYLPPDTHYNNQKFGIKIRPYKIASRFEKERRNKHSKYSSGYWLTANCRITSTCGDAKRIAYWLRLLYSYVQRRDVLFLRKGTYSKSGSFFTKISSVIYPQSNKRVAFVRGSRILSFPYHRGGISLFMDIALNTLHKMYQTDRKKLDLIIRSLDCCNISRNIPLEISFLTIAASIEYLAAVNYMKKQKINQRELDEFKNKVISLIQDELKKEYKTRCFYEEFLRKLKKNKPYYKHPLKQRLTAYLQSHDIDITKINKKISLDTIVAIRDALAHSLQYEDRHAILQARRDLRKILYLLLLRELGISCRDQGQMRLFF